MREVQRGHLGRFFTSGLPREVAVHSFFGREGRGVVGLLGDDEVRDRGAGEMESGLTAVVGGVERGGDGGLLDGSGARVLGCHGGESESAIVGECRRLIVTGSRTVLSQAMLIFSSIFLSSTEAPLGQAGASETFDQHTLLLDNIIVIIITTIISSAYWAECLFLCRHEFAETNSFASHHSTRPMGSEAMVRDNRLRRASARRLLVRGASWRLLQLLRGLRGGLVVEVRGGG